MRSTPPPGEPPQADETLDQLIGDTWIFQLAGGHRFSTDDLVCAWRAATLRPNARHYLDIGSGIGSVGLYVLGMFDRVGHHDVTLTGVEAQEVSVGLARRSAARNGLASRATFHHGDLRDPFVLPAGARFDLITGSPPYIPLGKGLLSPHPQRAACRIELRGSVVDYCMTAERWLAPGGRFTFVMAAADPRTQIGLDAAGFATHERLDVTFRAGNAPLITVITCGRAGDTDVPETPTRLGLTIRDATGRMTPEYLELRAAYGFSAEG